MGVSGEVERCDQLAAQQKSSECLAGLGGHGGSVQPWRGAFGSPIWRGGLDSSDPPRGIGSDRTWVVWVVQKIHGASLGTSDSSQVLDTLTACNNYRERC